MKYLLFALLTFSPLSLFSQASDSLAVVQTVVDLLTKSNDIWNAGKPKDALPVAQQAANISKDKWGEQNALYAASLHQLAGINQRLGQNADAETLYLKAIDIRAKVLGRNHPDYAASLSNLAILYMDKGDYAKSESLHLEAKEIRLKVFGKEHPDYAASLFGLASLSLVKSEYAKAEPLYLEVKRIFGKVYGTKNPRYAPVLNNLAVLYMRTGDYAKAEQYYLETKEIRTKTLGKDHPDYASTLTNLGALYMTKGDYAKAEPLYLEALAVLSKKLGKEHPSYASTLANLGLLYMHKGESEKAEPIYKEAIELRLKMVGADHPDYAASLNNLANLYFEKGRLAEAEPLYVEATAIRAKAFGKEHPEYAAYLENLAIVYTNLGDFAKAEPMYLEVKGIREKALGKKHPDYAKSLNTLSKVYQVTNRSSKSAVLLLEMNDIIHYLIEQSSAYSSESQMLAYLHKYESNTAHFYSFTQTHPNPALLRASFDNALFYNGYLLENARRLARSVAGADSLTRDTYERWQGCRRRLANEYAKPIAKRRYVAETEAEAEGYEKTLTRKLPAFGKTFQSPHWEDVRNSLRVGEAAVEFIYYNFYTPKATDSILYAALVLLPEDTMPHFIPLFEERQLQALFKGVNEALVIKHLYGNSPDLRRLLWDPLEPILRDVKTIYYSPAGLLHRINPAALLDESRQRISESRQWVRVGSTRELVTGRLADKSLAKSSDNTDSTIGAPPSAIIFGGITYDMDSLAYTAANSVELIDSTQSYQPKDGNFRYIATESPGKKVRSGSNPDGAWEPLASTAREADEINALLLGAGFRTEVQKALSASEERFKQIGVHAPSPRMLHLATHGFSYPDPKKNLSKGLGNTEPDYKLLDDPMLRSGLVLAGANFYCKNKRPLTNAEDGMLVAYEVRDLNLQNTELAVLSACQTGLGDVLSSEGVYGLQRAFRIAGAKFLIVSLWDVPDEQTQVLMRLFYQNWLEKQESLRDAFSHAQQKLRDNEPNPYLWAGFVLIE